MTLELYAAARRAFAPPGSLEDFREVYETLRRRWLVFRGADRRWTAEGTFGRLMRLDQTGRRLSLSNASIGDWSVVRACVTNIRHVKQTKTGVSSLVAVSKFLHFWNPRMFVIFDSGVMENYAFRHPWLQHEITREPGIFDRHITDGKVDERLDFYVRVLQFAGRFVAANPGIRGEFEATVRKHGVGAPVPEDISSYEATAFEWCILGLVNLPPRGASVGVDR